MLGVERGQGAVPVLCFFFVFFLVLTDVKSRQTTDRWAVCVSQGFLILSAYDNAPIDGMGGRPRALRC